MAYIKCILTTPSVFVLVFMPVTVSSLQAHVALPWLMKVEGLEAGQKIKLISFYAASANYEFPNPITAQRHSAFTHAHAHAQAHHTCARGHLAIMRVQFSRDSSTHVLSRYSVAGTPGCQHNRRGAVQPKSYPDLVTGRPLDDETHLRRI